MSKSPNISYCNRTQLMYMDGWTDSHLWVYLDWRCYSCWLPVVRSSCSRVHTEPPEQMTSDKPQAVWYSQWLALFVLCSCRVCRIWRFAFDFKHLAGSGTTYTLYRELEKQKFLVMNIAGMNFLSQFTLALDHKWIWIWFQWIVIFFLLIE